MTTWPSLPLEEWRDTRDTLHRWTQIVGKIRLAPTPKVNHWWHVALVDDPISLDRDERHRAYDAESVQRFWRVLALSEAVFTKFRAEFIGKCSPVHFFWGSFDLAVTRFSGRRAAAREGADGMMREAYSHEVSSAGWDRNALERRS